MDKLKTRFKAFIENEREYPILVALASGLYPLSYYYYTNFTLLNSWSQVVFFIGLFLIVPIVGFSLINRLVKKLKSLTKYNKYVLSILNFCWLSFLIVISIKGLKLKLLAVVLLVAFILALLLHKHLKKIVVLQFCLAFFICFQSIPDIYKVFSYSNEWQNQPDDIEKVEFKKRPNIYVIQPDGYASFLDLKKSPYNFDNSVFEGYLDNKGFTLYPGFRSNYYSTLSSNSSMFSMKHHYYDSPREKSNEVYNSREVIIGNNPVLSILKNNNYKTFLMMNKSYLLLNRASLGYDYCNMNYNEIPFFVRGFTVKKEIKDDFSTLVKNSTATNNFFFLQQNTPSHISTYKSTSEGKKIERDKYIKNLNKANNWLEDIVSTIESNDKNAVIIIVADHGGFVGLDYSLESRDKQNDESLVKSIFTSALAIKWPGGKAPNYDNKLKTNVNLFRVLFAYLGEEESYLNYLEEDKSYLVIHNGAPFGVYEQIDAERNVVFKKLFE